MNPPASRSLPSLRGRRACGALLTLVPAAASLVFAADAPWLYGIHFYGDPASGQVELMTGGKGIWSLEIVVPESDIWWHADWQRDNRFNAMVARGHTIICRIQPQWGYAIPQEPAFPMAEFLAETTAAATALQHIVHIWQVGNEMNIYGEWGGAVLPATTYVEAYRQIRTALRSVPSTLGEQIVLLGPVSPGPIAGERHTDGTVYLAQMCAQLAPDEVDGFAIHSYGNPAAPSGPAREDFHAGYVAQLAVLDHFGFSDKPVYMTEWARACDPGNAASEAESALFLRGGLQDLHAWSERPRAHAVASACWFIYDYDSTTWSPYSIAYLHTLNPPGADHDLFDSFQLAGTLDLPAGYPPPGGYPARFAPGAAPGENVARLAGVTADSGQASAPRAIDGLITPASMWLSSGAARVHWLQLELGATYALSGFSVHHAQAASVPPIYNTQAFHLETAPTADGPWTIESAVYNDAAVTQQTCLCPQWRRHVRLSVADPGRDTVVRLPEFEVYAIVPGDFDEDDDRDLVDGAAFQACFAGPEAPQQARACLWAHFDEDGVVDFADFAALAAELTGPAEPARRR